MSKLYNFPVEAYLCPRMNAVLRWVNTSSGIKSNKADAVIDLARSGIVVRDVEDYTFFAFVEQTRKMK